MTRTEKNRAKKERRERRRSGETDAARLTRWVQTAREYLSKHSWIHRTGTPWPPGRRQ